MKLADSRTLAVAASSLLVLVVGALVVQHLRHGWPFSLHHGVTSPLPVAAARAKHEPARVPVHPRAEVDLKEAEIDAIGVRVEPVRRETFSQPIRAVATVVPDESRLSHAHTRVAGWIERLYVTTTGERVRAGQPLAGIFSQELLASQTEYLAARRAATSGPASVVVAGAKSRLKVLGMTDAEIRAIEQAGEPRRLVTVPAPRTGVVLHRGVSVGTAVDPSTELLTIADLSRVWVFAEVPEGDIPSVEVGTLAELEFAASGLEPFEARVAFLYPTLSERTRTLRVRFVVDNPRGSLRPGLYGSATFQIAPREALTVPRDAVVDTGAAQHVFVAESGQRFVPRLVKLGTRLSERVEVREGLREGESIVASGVFLIDSESRLRASGGGMAHAHGSMSPSESGAKDPQPDSSAHEKKTGATGHEAHEGH